MNTMEPVKIDTEKAIGVVKDYFIKLKGANVEVGARRLIDWLNFDVITAREEKDQYIINCELLENLFSTKKERYIIAVNKSGKITEVTKENGQV